MAQFPEAFGMSVTVADMDTARRFYTELYPHDRVLNGVFAGINYLSLMRDGETLVNIFEQGAHNPLAAIMPTLKVDSVAAFEAKIKELGGNVVIPGSPARVSKRRVKLVPWAELPKLRLLTRAVLPCCAVFPYTVVKTALGLRVDVLL
ncbi:MAG: hypothetical protein HYR56_09980 [Acidobacteria bacterium]|nr:hypothetical protein [Acidobacteriota bacterium]